MQIDQVFFGQFESPGANTVASRAKIFLVKLQIAEE